MSKTTKHNVVKYHVKYSVVIAALGIALFCPVVFVGAQYPYPLQPLQNTTDELPSAPLYNNNATPFVPQQSFPPQSSPQSSASQPAISANSPYYVSTPLQQAPSQQFPLQQESMQQFPESSTLLNGGVPIYPAPAYRPSAYTPQTESPPLPSLGFAPPSSSAPVTIPTLSLPMEYLTENEKTAQSSELIQSKMNQAELDASEHFRRWEDIQNSRKSSKDPAWKKPLPDPRGPFLARYGNANQRSVSQVSFDMYDKAMEQNKEAYSWEKDEKHVFDWSLLDPVTFYERSKKWVGLGPDQKKAEAAMEEARKLMADKKYREAAKKFETAAKRWPDTVLEEDARFFAGECYYQEKEYARAFENYDRLIANFQSKHKDAAIKNIYEIAGYWIKKTESGVGYINPTDKTRPTFDTFGAAIKAYKSIAINDPRGPLSDESMLQLGFAYMNRGKEQGDSYYEEAASWFKQLKENARKHEYVARAAYLETICRKQAFSGSEYDAAQLEEAQKIADQTLKQFGPSLNENREKLMKAIDEISEAAADRRWTMGKYYEKQKFYGAARMQYQEILKTHPTSQYAERAKTRLEEIKDYPAEPKTFSQQLKSFIPWGSKE